MGVAASNDDSPSVSFSIPNQIFQMRYQCFGKEKGGKFEFDITLDDDDDEELLFVFDDDEEEEALVFCDELEI